MLKSPGVMLILCIYVICTLPLELRQHVSQSRSLFFLAMDNTQICYNISYRGDFVST